MIVSIALDLGSTSIKAGLLDHQSVLSQLVSEAAPPVHGENGRYESDALDYANRAEKVLSRCLEQIDTFPVLGLCSQRSSFVIWEKDSGTPITPLISWQDTRGEKSCLALQSSEARITQLTGLRLTPYYLSTKLRVVLQENPQWREQLIKGELLLGTLDTFLIWRWTGGKQFVSDVSMAARTLLLDIHTQQWSAELCELFGIDQRMLPVIKPSAQMNIRLDNGLLLQASLADQSAALFASVGEKNDVALINLGTGGFVIRYLPQAVSNTDGYLRTLVYQNPGSQPHIAIEGTLNSIASALAAYPVSECDFSQLAKISDIFCVAEPSGLGAPYFRQDIAMQFSNSVEHLSRQEIACLLLEAIIFRIARIVEEFDGMLPLKRVYLSGGLSELDSIQQGLTQCVTCEVYKSEQREASLQGAGMMAVDLKEANCLNARLITPAYLNSALHSKYHRWKSWIDHKLAQ